MKKFFPSKLSILRKYEKLTGDEKGLKHQVNQASLTYDPDIHSSCF